MGNGNGHARLDDGRGGHRPRATPSAWCRIRRLHHHLRNRVAGRSGRHRRPVRPRCRGDGDRRGRRTGHRAGHVDAVAARGCRGVRRLALTVVCGLATTLLTGCGSSGPSAAADAYLHAWAAGNFAGAATRTTNPTEAMQTLQRLRTDLHLTRVQARPGHVSAHGTTADAEYAASLDLQGVGTWHYTATLHMVRPQSH